MQPHDIRDEYGFYVDPEQLAHDLTILSLSKTNINFDNCYVVYDAYTKKLDEYRAIIEDKTAAD